MCFPKMERPKVITPQQKIAEMVARGKQGTFFNFKNQFQLDRPDPTMIRPFLSYAHEDRLQVRELYHKLKSAGFDPWLDHESR